MGSTEILQKYITYFEQRGHKRIANAPLVPQNDPTTLFTSSGMQPLIPYLLGETHPSGKRLVNVQNCFRAQDIEEIGDNRHTTFFRMLGNWSLGEYFKKEQIPWFFDFLTNKEVGLGLPPEKLYVTVFSGNEQIHKDEESIALWQEVFAAVGVEAKINERIFSYGVEKNWWSRSGVPEKMPAGEPGGPDTEVFYDFGEERKFHEYSQWKNEKCHVNCDCGRFMEIGNSVFMQYQKKDDGSFNELPQKNVDFGGGLERLAAAVKNDPDVFQTDIYRETITAIEKEHNVTYGKTLQTDKSIRIIADHLSAAKALIANGVEPSNKQQGYVARRLLRRAIYHSSELNSFGISGTRIANIVKAINDPLLETNNIETITRVIQEEAEKFLKTITQGLKKIEDAVQKKHPINAELIFDLYQSSGLPFDLTLERLAQKVVSVAKEEIQKANHLLEEHRKLSKTASAGMFKGGLADHSEKTIMGHTATHLLHQALRDVLGDTVHQTGSNITAERVRFDFNFDRRLTDEEIKKVQTIINQKIKEDLPVHFELISTQEAYQLGAIGLFMDTYGDKSKIYFIGDTSKGHKNAYSIEFCGGPHVERTGVLQSIQITKQENLGKNQKRLYLTVQQ